MIFWVVVFVLALVSVGAVAWPLASAESGFDPSPSPGETLKARLAAIEQDQAAGLIDDAAAEEAVLEAQKHALAAEDEAPPSAPARGWRMAAIFALAAAPLAAVVMYLNLGAPASLRAGASAATAAQSTSPANNQMAALEARVQNTPDDFEAWMSLGQAYILSDRADDAERAFERALKLDPANPDAHSAYGEALVMQSAGVVTTEAKKAFETALKTKPDDARAQYYLAEARYQVGDIEEAVHMWAKLINNAPADAPWLAAVGARLTDAASEAGIGPESTGLTKDAGQRLASAIQGDNQNGGDELDAVIGRIHSGNAQYQDWLRAASIYVERGQNDRARQILDQAADRYQNAPFVLAQINAAKASLENGQPIAAPGGASDGGASGPTAEQAAAISSMSEDEQKKMISSMVAGLAQRLQNQPDDIQGWRMLARSYSVLERPQDSLEAYRQLVKQAGANSEDWRNYAFALLAMRPDGDDTVNDELVSVLEKLQQFNADDPLALYHLGFAARQRGDAALAVKRWRRLLNSMSDDVPLRPTLERLIKETENS